MGNDSTNLESPFLGPGFPTYPAIDEFCRVSAPALANTNVYPAFLQQFNPPLSLRDRIAVYVWEPNGILLGPGYYNCTLRGSYNGLPLYVTHCCPTGAFPSSSSSSPGLPQPTTYNVAGTYTYVVPSGVSVLKVECGGGGSSGQAAEAGTNSFGRGGGGGAYARSNSVTVTAGQSWTVVVGAGGLATASGTGAQNNGSDSSFGSGPTTLAKGGNGRLGGASGSCIGDVAFSGGTGGNATNASVSDGGGGGSSAGNAAGGNPGTGGSSGNQGIGGTAPTGGGNGGNGATDPAGTGMTAGSGPGGGGGGGAHTASLASGGAAGADGQVIVTPIG